MTGENRYIFDRTKNMELRITSTRYNLKFKTPFRIAHGERESTPCVFVTVTNGKLTAYGEATLPPYLGISQDMVESFIQNVPADLLNTDSAEELQKSLHAVSPVCYPAMAAIEMAWHDLIARKNNVPLWKWLGLKKNYRAEGMFTIATANKDQLIRKLQEAGGMPLLKIKTYHGNEKEMIKLIRRYTDKPVAIDANQSWEIKEDILDLLNWLNKMNVILVEQPFRKEVNVPETIFKNSPVPLIADEAFQTIRDLDRIHGQYHGINVKLMKCGGIYPALEIIKEARKRNLLLMIGCMSESTCGCSSASHLLSLVNWYDLDGPLLIKNDPFDGMVYENGRIVLSERSGNGIIPNNHFRESQSLH